MTEREKTYTYDIFISYSHRDKQWVHGWLLPRLDAAGLRVCIDFRDFVPGLPILVNIERAVENSRKTLTVLTRDWVKSEWSDLESLLAQSGDPNARTGRMIPLQLKPCKPPPRIRMLTYVDFTQQSEWEFQLQRLLAAIKDEIIASLPLPPLIDYSLYLATVVKCDYQDIWGERSYSFWSEQYVPLFLRLPDGKTTVKCEPAVVKKYSPLVITGDPGSGKTTLLRHLAMEFAKKALREHERTGSYLGTHIPVYVNLGDYESSSRQKRGYENILVLIQSELRNVPEATTLASALGEEISEQPFVFLFDGLNEVPRDQQAACVGELRQFIDRFSNNLYLVASRRVSYQDVRLRLGYPHVLNIDGMSTEGMEEYLRRHLEDPQAIASISKQLNDNPRLRELAQNPLLLAIIIQVYEKHCRRVGTETQLPRSRGKLIGQCVQSLLERGGPSGRSKWQHDILVPLGYQMQVEGLQLARRDVYSIVNHVLDQHRTVAKSDEVLGELLRDQILIETADGRIGFWHQAFQEYFAACQIKAEWEDECKKGEYPKTEKYVQDPHWHYIFALMAGIVAGGKSGKGAQAVAEELFDFVRLRSKLLAAMCLSNTDDLSKEVEEEFVDTLRDESVERERGMIRQNALLLGELVSVWILGLLPLSLALLILVPFDPTLNILGLAVSVVYYMALPKLLFRAFQRITKRRADDLLAQISPILLALSQAGIASSYARSALSDIVTDINSQVPAWILGDPVASRTFREAALQQAYAAQPVSSSTDKQLWQDLQRGVNLNPTVHELVDRLVKDKLDLDILDNLVEAVDRPVIGSMALLIFYNAFRGARRIHSIAGARRNRLVHALRNVLDDSSRRDNDLIWAYTTLCDMGEIQGDPRLFLVWLKTSASARFIVQLPRRLFRLIRVASFLKPEYLITALLGFVIYALTWTHFLSHKSPWVLVATLGVWIASMVAALLLDGNRHTLLVSILILPTVILLLPFLIPYYVTKYIASAMAESKVMTFAAVRVKEARIVILLVVISISYWLLIGYWILRQATLVSGLPFSPIVAWGAWLVLLLLARRMGTRPANLLLYVAMLGIAVLPFWTILYKSRISENLLYASFIISWGSPFLALGLVCWLRPQWGSYWQDRSAGIEIVGGSLGTALGGALAGFTGAAIGGITGGVAGAALDALFEGAIVVGFMVAGEKFVRGTIGSTIGGILAGAVLGAIGALSGLFAPTAGFGVAATLGALQFGMIVAFINIAWSFVRSKGSMVQILAGMVGGAIGGVLWLLGGITYGAGMGAGIAIARAMANEKK